MVQDLALNMEYVSISVLVITVVCVLLDILAMAITALV